MEEVIEVVEEEEEKAESSDWGTDWKLYVFPVLAPVFELESVVGALLEGAWFLVEASPRVETRDTRTVMSSGLPP